MPIGDRIRTLRKAHGLNQTELGDRLGVKTNAVSKWECGRVEDIPMSKVKAMAALFNVPVSYLIDDSAKAPTESSERSNSNPKHNIIRIAGRDGSYQEKSLTDDDLAALKVLLDRLPDASNDL